MWYFVCHFSEQETINQNEMILCLLLDCLILRIFFIHMVMVWCVMACGVMIWLGVVLVCGVVR